MKRKTADCLLCVVTGRSFLSLLCYLIFNMDGIQAVVYIMDIVGLVDRRRVPRRRIFKERADPFMEEDNDFKKKYRFNKDTVRRVIELVRDEIRLSTRGRSVSVELQVLTALRCWARNEVQDDAGDIHGLSQPTVHRICARVSRAIAKLRPQFVRMPTTLAEQECTIREFEAIANFPAVVGAIDCTHIRIKKTGGDAAQYYINRKGYYSLNVQVVCNAKLKITDVVARWRGGTHDSRIFNESVIKERFINREFHGRLLGDSGYECQPYLFTPVRNPQNAQEEQYNKAHISTRNTVERCFGVWKQRFRCLLGGMSIKLDNIKPLIVALAVLHNIALEMGDAVDGYYRTLCS